jgi:RNA polymerase sigma factor (sigma-70 family)
VAIDDRRLMVEELAAKQSGRLRRFLRTRVRNAADIPDIIQEAFLRFLRVPSHETIRVPEAYIFTIARHVALQHKLEAAASETSIELDKALSELRCITDADPALEVTAEQCLQKLDEALHDMAPKVQTTFLLYRRDGMSMEDISERLGISRQMAKKYLVKALVQFRKRLKETE